MNKFVITRPFADPEAAARKLMDGRIHIELINAIRIARQPGRVQGWSRPRDRTRLALEARAPS
jgi:hypothetical protein